MNYQNHEPLKRQLKALKISSVDLAPVLKVSPAVVRQYLGGFMVLSPENEKKILKYIDIVQTRKAVQDGNS